MNDKKIPRGNAIGDLIGSAVKHIRVEPTAEPVAIGEGTVIEIDPRKTRMNDLHRRSPTTMSGSAIQEMVEMFRATGQQTPAKGWRLDKPGPEGEEIVLVYGARRRAAAMALGVALKVELMPAQPDRGALIKMMHGENRGRLDYLPLEDAREYKAFLDSGEYRTADEMAAALGQDKSRVSRLLSLLKLPPEVLDLYTDPSWMPLVKGWRMATECANAEKRAKLIEAAKGWREASGRGDPTPTLMKALTAKTPNSVAAEIFNAEGKSVGSVRGVMAGKGPVTIVLGKAASEGLKKDIAAALAKHYGLKL